MYPLQRIEKVLGISWILTLLFTISYCYTRSIGAIDFFAPDIWQSTPKLLPIYIIWLIGIVLPILVVKHKPILRYFANIRCTPPTCIAVLAVVGLICWLNNPIHIMYFELGIVGCGLWHYYQTRQIYRPPLLAWALASIPLMSFVGLMWTDEMSYGLWLGNMQLILLLPLVSSFIRLDSRQMSLIVSTVFWVCLSLLWLHLFVYISMASVYTPHIWDCFTFNKTYLSHLPGIPIHWVLLDWLQNAHPTFLIFFYWFVWLVNYCTDCQRSQSTLSYASYAVLAVLYSVCLQSRYGIIMSILVVGCWVLHTLYTRKYWKSLIASIGLVAILGIITSNHGVLAIFNDPIRKAIYSQALESWLQAPVFGLGSGTDRTIHLALGETVNSHNTILSSLVDLGVLGLIPLALFFASSIYQIKKERNIILALLLLLLLPLSMMESVLYVSGTCYIIPLLVFLAISYERESCTT